MNHNLGFQFLSISTRNYKSARLLYLTNCSKDAAILAHESLEKILKSYLYLKGFKRKQLKNTHNLKKLKGLCHTNGFDISSYGSIIDYYESSYQFRYPDQKMPKSFSWVPDNIHWLDVLFVKVTNRIFKEFKQIIPKRIRYSNGYYALGGRYYTTGNSEHIKDVTFQNLSIDEQTFIKARSYWHKEGFFLKDKNGITSLYAMAL